MNCREKEEPTTARPSPAPKRVAGGIIVKSKKKKKKKIRHNAGAGASIAPSVSVSSRVPSILSSIPNHNSSEEDSKKSEQPTPNNKSSEFDDNDDDFDNDELLFDAVPSDAMMCLQTYTRSSSSVGGLMAETCAYCPIYSYEGGGSNSNSNNNGGTRRCTSSHAAPFLPRHVLLHLLDPSTSNNSSSSSCANVSTRTHVEQEIKQLASSNKIRLLQLHGTAASSSAGWKGDGNDNEDVALMETAAYETAAGMALQSYFQGGQSETLRYTCRVEMVHCWFARMVLTYFAGRIWFSSGSLETFYEYAIISHQTQKNDNMIPTATNGSTATATATATLSSPRVKQYTMTQMKGMIQQLEHAGLLLPRRGVGATAAGGGDGYWFSLPGIGKASKSIVDGRTNLLRRLKSSYYKEKKRSVLEQEIGRVKRQDHPTSSSSSSGTTTSSGTKRKLEQSGKFVVLDLLAKGWVSVHKTSTGDQRIRLVE